MAKLVATAGGIQMDDGTYEATVLEIVLTEPTVNSPNDNPWYKWLFQVYDSEQGQEMAAGSSIRFGPKAKTRQWIEALLQRKLDVGEEIDPEGLYPKDCQVVVKHDDSGFVRITDVLPIRKRPAPTRQREGGGVIV